jgi:hypothetical protein
VAKRAVEGEPAGNLSDEAAFKLVVRNVNDALSEQFKLLLETKHLYQKVSISFDEIVSVGRKRVFSGVQDRFDIRLRDLPKSILLSEVHVHALERPGQIIDLLLIIATNIKIYCEKCSRIEAFKPIWWTEAANELHKPSYRENRIKLPITVQMWLITYQCQSCLGLPQGMLVRRNGWNFYLEGRSPIEYVEVPQYIPKAEVNWFRDALIAKNTGKTLAALFYLRTFIEQFARRQTSIDGRMTGTEIMEKYSDLLPMQHRSSIPSLKEWYEKLSESIHGAKEDSVLFESARREIERHFDIRRVFQIPEISPGRSDP